MNSDCLKTSITIMIFTGVWLSKRFEQKPIKIYYITFAAIVQGFIFVYPVLAEIAYVFTVLGDTEKVVDAAVLLFSHLVQGVKVFTIWFQQGRIKQVINMIDGPNFTRSDPTKKELLNKRNRIILFIGNLMIGSAAVTATFWCIVPLLKNEINLPLKIVTPFDLSSWTAFIFTYGHCSLSVFLVGVGDAAENYVVAALISLASTQLDLLSYELKNIYQNLNSGKTQSTSYEETVACVKHHQNIIEYVEELANIFGFAIFCQFLTSSLILCMTVFKLTVSTEPIEVMTMVFYLICIFMEILMYCYPGDLLLHKSIQISEAAYSSNWVECDTNTRRLLLLTTLRAQRPLAIVAGGLYTVSLPTATSVTIV